MTGGASGRRELEPTALAMLGALGSGVVYDLGLEIGADMPQPSRAAFVPFSLAFSTTAEGSAPAEDFQFAAEVIIGALHTSTHIDAFVHVQSQGRIHGGALERDVRTDRGFTEHGAETIPPLIARGLLLDVARHRSEDPLPDGYEISVDDLADCLGASALTIARGDVVLVRTGKVREFVAAPATYHDAQPGVGLEAAIWLAEQGIAALGTDTWGTEPMPFADPSQTVHVELLVRRGVYLVENLDLELIAADAVSAGLFVCLPLKLTGATGSWVRPVLLA